MHARMLAALAGLLFSLSVLAQNAPEEGLDYAQLMPPQATDAPGKVQVVEFFWYRCPHCYALEPDLDAWLKPLPADVQFRRIPAILNDDWAIDGRVFYALQTIGELERLHRPLFDAIHRDGGVRLHGEAYAKWVAEWLARQNVDMAKYDAALHSFSVESNMRRAAQMARAYGVGEVPTLAVQGRYVLITGVSRRKMLATADYLIGEARRQLAGNKP